MAKYRKTHSFEPPKEELTCLACGGPLDDTGACANPTNEKCDRSELSVADRPQATPPEEEVQVVGLDSFEDGIIFALTLLKDQVSARGDECDALSQGASSIVGAQLNTTRQTLVGMLVGFETALMKGVSERRAAMRKAKP